MPLDSSFSPLSIGNLRELLKANLQIRSVFPCYDEPHRPFNLSDEQIAARCMLDKKDTDKSKLVKDGLDDVVVKVCSYGEEAQSTDKMQKVGNIFVSKYLNTLF
ncbi:hypothetical protein EON65_21315 [archaeon]|nr:MAG: hypothetical protein EON65_21315 [archaeon]